MTQMQTFILVLNSGSSSIKCQLFKAETEASILSATVENIGSDEVFLRCQEKKQSLGTADYQTAFKALVPVVLAAMPKNGRLHAIGHRVVHGGQVFTKSVLIDTNVIDQIQKCSELAPLHNPANLMGIFAAQEAFPGIPQVAVFDTAFHQTMPEKAYLYALPYEYYSTYDVRRYGFHGISYQYLAQKAADLLKKPLSETALICAHLGNGCSVCAALGGKSFDTSMGLTPLEGLVMGTRSGDIDPGLFEYLTQKLNINVCEFTEILNKKSGLLGISGSSFDMRILEAAAKSGDQHAKLAIEIFCYRLAKMIASYMVPLGRIDALVFSGGIGENAVEIREATLKQLAFLGFQISPERNLEHGEKTNGKITQDNSSIALVIKTQEELMIAREVTRIVGLLNNSI